MVESKTPEISVVIRTFNEEAHIGNLLDSLAQQSNQDFETIIVDSGSTDKTLLVARQHPVKVVSFPFHEFTYGRSLNRGISSAIGEFIVSASAHVLPNSTDWLQALIDPFVDPDVAMAYGRQLPDSRTKFSERQILDVWFPAVSNLNQNYPFANNANSAIRRSAWIEQQYDESLPALEEIAWTKLAVEDGKKIAYVADAAVIHIHDESLGDVFTRYHREAVGYKRIFPSEKFTVFNFVRYLILNTGSDLFRSLKDKSIFWEFGHIVAFRFLQFWGTFRGFADTTGTPVELKHHFYHPRGNPQRLDRSKTPVNGHAKLEFSDQVTTRSKPSRTDSTAEDD